jgi:HEPN domain-containing protein
MSAPPEEVEAEGRRWLRFATEDLDLAERDLEDARTVPRGACLHAQQAAEKSIKAALILWPEPTRDDAREAVALASEILRAIRRDLEANGLLPAEIA